MDLVGPLQALVEIRPKCERIQVPAKFTPKLINLLEDVKLFVSGEGFVSLKIILVNFMMTLKIWECKFYFVSKDTSPQIQSLYDHFSR